MIGLKFTPHFRYITILCYKIIDFFIIDRTTRSISVNKNDQHVQVWNPTITFFENPQKLKIKETKNRKN